MKKMHRSVAIAVNKTIWAEKLENRCLLSTTSPVMGPLQAPATAQAIVLDASTPPSVASVSPANGATGVSRDSAVEADLNLTNGGLDPNTVNTSTVTLVRSADNSVVPAVVNTTGGGDAIILQPSVLLDASTAYTFTVTSGVKDVTGVAMTPYSESFTTGTTGGAMNSSLAFQKVTLPTAQGAPFTAVNIGPDGKLYASTEDGRIFRYTINSDGTLSVPQVITALKDANGGNRLITGFAFDPHSSANSPILWVSNTFYALSGATNGPDFSSKLTVMSGINLDTVQDALVNLPRSVADHVNNQPVFGPDGALYFSQAGENAFGAPDVTWGNRPEHLLSGAILRLDTTKVTPGQPLDVKTTDAGGSYNPFAAGAPLTIYATGVRNAFDLLWASDGTLWAPNNGSSAGGNAPAFNSSDPNQINGPRIDTGQPYAGANVPGLTAIQQTENDYIYKIIPGEYYGHPNPTRGEYVLDGGNPTAGVDQNEFSAYPVGTQPDANYYLNFENSSDPAKRSDSFDFGPHHSPDGIIEYSGSAFGGALNGKMLVAEYSAGDDIAVLSRDASGNIVSIDRGVAGFTNFVNPVDLAEDPRTGNIYVAELGTANRITLLRPQTPGGQVSTDKMALAFNSIAAGNSGAGASGAVSVTITNTGNATLTIPAGGVTIINDPSSSTQDAGDFKITSGVPTSIAVGQSATITLTFTAPSVGIKSAFLQIQSNDPAHPTTQVALRGIGTAGQFANLEPSLQNILSLYEIPDNVGEPNPSSTFLPTPPATPNDEVLAQRFVKAASGPVTVQMLASFSLGTPVAERFGYYAAGEPDARTEVFNITSADQQTVNATPKGATSFDPGATVFGLYAAFPHFTDNGHERYSYSEDAFNTWDTNVMRKMRAYPLKNADGSVVSNAYVVAFEDYNLQYDSNDLVAIVRNVTALPAGASLGLQNLDGVPAPDRLVFSRIQVPNATIGDQVHDTDTLRLFNTGQQPLTISALTLDDTANWQLVNPPAFPAVIAPGASLDVMIKFVAQAAPQHSDNQTNDTATQEPGVSPQAAGGVWTGHLTIASNDAAQPSKTVTLAGYWQHTSENEEEPGLNTIVNLLDGYNVVFSTTPQPNYPETTAPKYYGEEVASAIWSVAYSSQPVTVTQLSAFHNQGNGSKTSWYNQGSGTLSTLFTNSSDEGQSVLPLDPATGKVATASFSPAGNFGWNLDGENSDDSKNVGGGGGHHVRFFPVRDANGNLVPNTWIVALDYGNETTFENYDFQDLSYLVTNMRPAGHPPAPTDLQTSLGTAGVSLQWDPAGSTVSYDVFRSVDGGASTQLNSKPITGGSFLDTTAPAGSSISYLVTAVDTTTMVESLPANATVSLSGPPETITDPVPPAPANVQAAPSAQQVTITWAASDTATDYRIERLAPGAGSFVEIGTASATSFTDTAIARGATYTYRVRAENGAGLSSYSATASATVPNLPSVSVVLGAGGNKSVKFTDADGTTATFTLKGPGSATIEIVGDNPQQTVVKGVATITGTNNFVGSIAATGTTGATTLTITTKGGNKMIDVPALTSDGSFKSIVAKTTNLTGNLSVAGAIATLSLNNASNGTIAINGLGPALSLTLAAANNVGLVSASAVKVIQAGVWNSPGATISVPLITQMKVKGNASFAMNAGVVKMLSIGGVLSNSTLTFSAGGSDVGKMTVGGLSGTTIHAAGNLGAISARSLLNSSIYAGVASLPGGAALPSSAGDFAAQASIASVILKKSGSASMVNSNIAAWSLGKLSLAKVSFANAGNAFGVAGHTIASLSASDSGSKTSVNLKKLSDPTALANLLMAKNIDLQDFAIRLL
jgi:hypothetical protein